MAAPLILFAYNRPLHLQRVLEALCSNELASSTDLVAFSDGPRDDYSAEGVKSVRLLLHSIQGFHSVEIVERQKNLGLSRNVIDGVTETLKNSDSCIVLEDDLLPSGFFLQYMNDALAMYRDDHQVISIHGYVYPVRAHLPETFFLPGADCWGWATWKRGWNLFQSDGSALLDELERQHLGDVFDYNGAYPFMEMLKGQIEGTNDSWAIRWRASAFLNKKLSLYPGRSLIQNIGNDGSGRHSSPTSAFEVELSTRPVTVGRISIEAHQEAFKAVEKFWRSQYPFHRRVINRLKDLLAIESR